MHIGQKSIRGLRKAVKTMAALALAAALAFPALPLTAQAAAAGGDETSFTVRIVHTNDIHARVAEDEKSGQIGMARLSTIIRDWTADADMKLVLDSGDLFHGQPIATLVQGGSVALLAQACGYDAMTAGNHDWSYGKERLKELADLAGMAMLTGNVADETGAPFFDEAYCTREVTKDGQTLKVGVFGVIDPRMYGKTTPANVEGLTFTDPAAYANQTAALLRAQGCDLVIALSHTEQPAALAGTVSGVDLWLCGHEHISLDTTVTAPDGKTAYVEEDGYYLQEAGLLELTCTLDAAGNITALRCERQPVGAAQAAAAEPDAYTAALLDKINEVEREVLDRKIGFSPEALDGTWEALRIGETALGKAVADAYLLATGADAAFENAGGIRASIAAGDVTYGDVIGVSPYGNYIVTKEVTGSALKEILETSLELQAQNAAANASGDWDAWPEHSGSFLQVGGVTVTYDPSLESGSRILSLEIGGAPYEPSKRYTVAVNNYMAVSETYPQLAQAPVVGEFAACDEALTAYFRQENEAAADALRAPRLVAVSGASSPQ